jgi:ribosome-associated protein
MNEPISAQASNSPSPTPREARQFALQAAGLAANTRCHDVVLLDLGGLSPVCDYFVIASGTSARQMRAVADEISEIGEKSGFHAYSAAGYDGESWMLVDFIDVVVHLFSDEARRFYDLDNRWGDAKRVDWKAEAIPSEMNEVKS